MSTITDLIVEQGRAAAAARAQSGAIWGRAAESVAQIPGQIMAQRRQGQQLDLQQQEMTQRMALQGQEGQKNAIELGGMQRSMAGTKAVADAVQANTTLTDAGHYVTNEDAVDGTLRSSGFAQEADIRSMTAAKNQIELNTAQHSNIQAQLDQNTYLKNQLEPVVNEKDPVKQKLAYDVLRGNQAGLKSQHPFLSQLPPTMDISTLTAQFNAAETADAKLADAFKQSEVGLNTSKAKQADAEAAAATAKAGPPNVQTLMQIVSGMPDLQKPENASLLASTTARIANARNHEEGQKAIEDAQNQIGQVNVAKQKAPISISIATGTAAAKDAQMAAAVGGPVDASRPDPKTANIPDPKTGMTPAGMYQAAMEHALKGTMPSIGFGQTPRAMAVRLGVMNKAAAIAQAAGVDLPTVQTQYKSNAAALNKVLPIAVMTASSAGAANDNLQLALDASADVARSGAKFANRYTQWAQGELTPAKGLAQFELYIYTAAREYAKVVSGSAASTQGLTDSASREAAKLLSAAQAPDVFASVAQGMQKDMANVTGNQTKAIAAVNGTIANFFSAVNGGGPVGAPAPSDVNTRAAAVLQQNGKASDPASVSAFLKNNPTFK